MLEGVNLSDGVLGLVLLGAGWLVRQLWELWKETRGKRKTELQHLEHQRDACRAERQQWRQSCYESQAMLVRDHGIPQSELPGTPDDDNK